VITGTAVTRVLEPSPATRPASLAILPLDRLRAGVSGAVCGVLAVGSIVALAQRHLDGNLSSDKVPGPALAKTGTQGARS